MMRECPGCGFFYPSEDDGLCEWCHEEIARELSGDPHDRFDPDDPECFEDEEADGHGDE